MALPTTLDRLQQSVKARAANVQHLLNRRKVSAPSFTNAITWPQAQTPAAGGYILYNTGTNATTTAVGYLAPASCPRQLRVTPPARSASAQLSESAGSPRPSHHRAPHRARPA